MQRATITFPPFQYEKARNSSPGQIAPKTTQAKNLFDRLMNKLMSPSRIQRPERSLLLSIRDYWRSALPARRSINANRAAKQYTEASEPENISVKKSGADKLNPYQQDVIKQAIHKAEVKYKIPKRLLESIIKAESDYNPNAMSSAGAQGLMQLMPNTAREVGVKNAFDIRENIEGGARYFRKMMDLFDQDITKALAAYNSGPGTVRRYGGIPPYRETKNYVKNIMQSYTREA